MEMNDEPMPDATLEEPIQPSDEPEPEHSFPIGGPVFEMPDGPSPRRGKARVGTMVPVSSLVEQMEAAVVREPTPADVALQGNKETLIARATALQVVDAASYQQAVELGQVLTGFVKDAEAHFDPDCNRAYTLWKSLTTKRKDFLDPLQAGIEALKGRAVRWFQTEEQKRREEQHRRDIEAQRLANEEAARKEQAAAALRTQGDHETANELVQEAQEIRQSPPPAAPVQSAAPTVAGAGVRANWVHEVTDLKALVKAVAEGKVSPEAIQANDTYLRGRAKTDKNTWACPGVRFYDKGTMALKGR
tara:strand:- start:498 stop:1409 length:912 start_codon:yes stop_codon:yes gene_type:complete